MHDHVVTLRRILHNLKCNRTGFYTCDYTNVSETNLDDVKRTVIKRGFRRSVNVCRRIRWLHPSSVCFIL